MLAQQCDQPGRERHRAAARGGLREWLERGVPGDLRDCPDNAERGDVEVERVVAEPDRLAPPQARAAAEPGGSTTVSR